MAFCTIVMLGMIGITEVQALELVEGNLTAKGQSLQVTQVSSDRGQIKVVWKYTELYEGNTTLTFKMNGQEILYVNDEATQEGILFGEPSHRVSMSQAGPLSIVSRDVPNKRGTREITMTLRFSYSVAFDFSAVSEDCNVESLFGKFKVELTPGDLDSKPDSGGDSGSSGGSGGGGSGGGGNNSGGDSGLPPDEGENEGGGNGEKPDTGGGGDIEWGEGDRSGYEMEWEHEAQSMTDKGRQKIWFYYPMSQGGTVSMTLVANGSEVLSFTDHVAEDGSLDIAPGTKTYSLTNSSGMLQVLDEKVYQKDKRRVLELEVRFMKGCLVRGEAHSTVPLGWPIATCSFNVSLVPGDEGDKNDGPLQVSVQDISSGTKRLTANYYGPIENYKYIIWKIHVDTNLNGKYEASEQLPSSRITFNSSYTEAVWLIYRQGNSWPGYNVNIRLSSEWEEGAQENPQYDPSKPSPDDPNGGGGGAAGLAAELKFSDDVDVGDISGGTLVGEAIGARVYIGDRIPVSLSVTTGDPFTVDWSLTRLRAYEITGPQQDDPNFINNPLVNKYLDESGGSLEINAEGYYTLSATIMTSSGESGTVTVVLRVYSNPVAVFANNRSQSWEFSAFQEILVSTATSYGNDQWGPAWHAIDHSLDRVTIEPLDSQSTDSIYVMNSGYTGKENLIRSGNKVYINNSNFAPSGSPKSPHRAIGFSESGRYKITYTCTNAGGKTDTTSVIVVIGGQADPIIQAALPSTLLRDASDSNWATGIISGPKSNQNSNSYITVTCSDNSYIDDLTVTVDFDSDNDNVFNINKDKRYVFTTSGTKDDVTIQIVNKESLPGIRFFDVQMKTKTLGNYRVILSCKKKFESTALPIIPVPDLNTVELELLTRVDNTSPSALYSAQPIQKVDVVLALGEFQNQKALKDSMATLRNKLNASGNYIDAKIEDVATSVLDSSTVSPSKIFSTWVNYPGVSMGPNYDAGWELQGNKIATTKNVNWTGYWDPQYVWVTDATFEFEMSYETHPDPMGWTIRMNKQGNSYSFYAIEIAPSGPSITVARIDSWTPGSYAMHGGPVYHRMINGQDGTYGSISQYGQASSNQGARGTIIGTPAKISNVNGKYKIENIGNNIKVYKDGALVLNVTDTSGAALTKGSFGPYTCSQYETSYWNIKVSMGATKTLGEAVSDVAWRDGSMRFILHATDVIPPDFKNLSSVDFAYTLSKVMQSNAYVANMGTSVNKGQFDAFATKLRSPRDGEKAIFVYNNPLQPALNNIGDWIIDIVRRMRKDSNWVLVGTPVAWTTEYKDANKDSAFIKGPGFLLVNKLQAEKWRYRHDESFFDNKLRREAYSDVWVVDPVSIFNNPGKFTINYKQKDNPFNPDINFNNLFHEFRYWSQDYDKVTSSEGSSGIIDPGLEDLDQGIFKDKDVAKSKEGTKSLWQRIKSCLILDVNAAGYTAEYSEGKVAIHAPSTAGSDISIRKGDVEIGSITAHSDMTEVPVRALTELRKPGNTQSDKRGLKVALSWDAVKEWDVSVPVQMKTGDKTEEVTLEFKVKPTGYRIYKNDNVFKDTTETSIEIPILNIISSSKFYVVAYYGDNETPKVEIPISKKLLYSGEAKDDTFSMFEDGVSYFDVKANDEHDDRYDIPKLEGAKVLSGSGSAKVIERKDIPNSSEFPGDEYIEVRPDPDWSGTLRIEYTYALIRSDLPQLKAIVTVTVEAVNDSPVVTNVDRGDTDSLNAITGQQIRIPASMLVAHASDVDSPRNKLRVSYVTRCTAGEVVLAGDEIIVSTIPGFYGMLRFEFAISDGQIDSLPATVDIWVSKGDLPPRPVDISDRLEIALGSKRLDLLSLTVTNGNSNLVIKSYDGLTLNGVSTTLFRVSTLYQGTSALTEVVLTDLAQFADGDKIAFSYTVGTLDNADLTGSGRVVLELFEDTADDSNEGVLYVHRKPVARFTPSINVDGSDRISSVRIDEGSEASYDLDHSITDSIWKQEKAYSYKGLRAFYWGIRTSADNWDAKMFDANDFSGNAKEARSAGLSWINSKLQSMGSSGKFNSETVYVMLSVQDIDGENSKGVWSDDYIVTLTNQKMKPLALFEVPAEMFYIKSTRPAFQNDFSVKDISYSPMGKTLTNWKWTLTLPDSKTYEISSTSKSDAESKARSLVSDQVNALYANINYKPKTPTFKLSLVVTDSLNQKSDAYSVSFRVFRKNEAPSIEVPGDSQLSSLQASTLYELDGGEDGAPGDSWGSASSDHTGKIDFVKLLKITDDQQGTVKVSYVFAGQAVPTRESYRNSASPQYEKSYMNLAINGVPFNRTVTEEGFKPGAYKLTVTAKDDPDEGAYGEYASETSVLETKPDKKPYHLYVVPKIDMYPHYQFGDWIDGKINAKTGQTLAEAGLTPEDVAPCTGDFVTVYVDCNQYVTGVSGYRDLNGSGNKDAGDDMEMVLEKGSMNSDGTIRWSKEVELEEIPDPVGDEVLTKLKFGLQADTNWGSETGDVMRSKKKTMEMLALATKLYDFNVQYVTDPDVSEELPKRIQETAIRQQLGGMTVGDLAIDRNEQNGELPRKGYSFYFEVWSKGLSKENDWVRITPKFYALDVSNPGSPVLGSELTGYLQQKDKSWKSFQDKSNDELAQRYPLFYEGEKLNKLGSHAEMNLPISLRSIEGTSQRWKGRYGIPASARFAPAGVALTDSSEYKGDILVCFNFKAVKKGVERVDYVQRRQWAKERVAYNNPSKGFYVGLEETWKASGNFIGSVIVYDGLKSVEDEYSVSPTWNE